MSTDLNACLAECRAAQNLGTEISDAVARTIAAMFHDGAFSDTYRFVSTGATGPATSLWGQFFPAYDALNRDEKLLADMLGTYLLNREDTGAVHGWSSLWVR